VRGLHFQAPPWEEEKVVRVTRGAVFDVIVDLRFTLPTFGRWFGVNLTADNRRQVYIPKGAAHGFQTLTDNTEVLYGMTVPFHPEAACGVRWDDPELSITWPDAAAPRGLGFMSPKDATLPSFSELRSQFGAVAPGSQG
jgi:dTDP-4-dehydrorhamnose 3,5-epimerase